MLPSSLNKFAGEEENPMFCCLGVEGGWKTQTMIFHSTGGWRRDFSQLWSFDISGRDRDRQFLDLYLTPPEGRGGGSEGFFWVFVPLLAGTTWKVFPSRKSHKRVGKIMIFGVDRED